MDKKSIPEFIRSLFQLKPKKETPGQPDNLFTQCPDCKQIVYNKKLDHNWGICPECGYHHRISNQRWIELLADKSSVSYLFQEFKAKDPLQFPNYAERVTQMYAKGVDEALDAVQMQINRITLLVGIMNSDFLMGSMGSIVGERIAQLFERGAERDLPLLLITRSGGARMQEGVVSLMQMTKTAAAAKRFAQSGNLFVDLLTDPTTGGVSASFAMLGDIILAEPKALIGFAGPRVIEQTIKQKLPEGFQRAEFLVEKGYVDMIVPRNELKARLTDILRLHQYDT
jgi:acetyl-CoA carboxylase carboxyl transferase subunit beta